MYVGGTYARLVYNWYQNIFHAIAVLIVFHAANKKNRRKQDQNNTANQERKIKTLLSSPIHLAHHRSAVAPLFLLYRFAVALLSHCYRYAVTLLSPRCPTTIAPLAFRCRSAAVATLSRCCRTVIAPVLLHCRSAAVAPAVATQSHLYHTAIAPLSLLLACSRLDRKSESRLNY